MKKIYVGLVLLIVLLAGGYLYSHKTEVVFGGLAGAPIDIYGTQTGTSTAATASGSFFGATNATSSKAMALGTETDMVLLTIKAKTASTSALGGSFYEWDIFGSNDANCDTSSSTAGTGAIKTIKSDINWFSADPTNSKVSGRVTNPGTATGTSVLLTNVNWKCLNFQANGSSTTVLMQMKEKTN